MCKSYTKLLFALIVVVGITACGGGGGGGGGGAATPTPKTVATLNLTAIANSTNQITISWSEVADATYYEVYRSTSLSTAGVVVSPSSLTITSYIDTTGLTANTTYYYWLKSCEPGPICSDFSTSTTATTAPLPPTILTATPNSESQITINWAASAGASSYKVYRSTSTLINSTPIDTAVETTHTDTGLIAETQYYYWLKACNIGDICSAYSAQIDATTAPLPPTILDTTADSARQITIKWLTSTGADYYNVYRSTSSFSAASSLRVNNNPISATNYIDIAVIANTTYSYWLKSCKTTGVICSDYSSVKTVTTPSPPPAPIDTTPPATPTSLSAVVNGTNQITISWSEVVSATYYQVYRGTSVDTSLAITLTLDVVGISHTDTTVAANTQYYYWVKACKTGDICSGYSTEITATTAPAAPTSLSAVAGIVNGTNQIIISWSSSTGADSYKVYRSTSSFSDSGTIIVPSLSGINHADTGLMAETQYYYWLKACNTNDICSGFSAPIETTTLVAPPVAPTNLSATPNSSSQITIKWSVSTDADYYIVNRSTSIFANSIIIESSLATTSYVDTGLMAGTQYHYWLKACKNVAICSNYSTEIEATTELLPPTSLSAVASMNQITIDWIGSTGAGYYEIYRSTSSFIAPSSLPINSPLVADGTSYTDAIGLTANTQYYYWIKACKTGICSEYSAKKSVKTFSLINDTGIIWSGDYPSGNNSDCSGTNTIAQQDCLSGRDAEATANTLVKIGGGMAGFDFTKLGTDGSVLTLQNETWDDTAGNEIAGTKWSCVRDNHTGLVWEVKNNDGNTPTGTDPTVSSDNIHHKDNKYRWGGLTADGLENTTSTTKGTYYSDWNSLVTGTNNSEALCGFVDWRVPDIIEVSSIVNRSGVSPAIDQNYFPNTAPAYFWLSSSNSYYSNYAWISNSYNGNNTSFNRGGDFRVRLVRGGQ